MRLKTASLALLAVLSSSGMALAQDQNAGVDPADSLIGLWRTEHAEGSSATSVPPGKLVRISRSSVTGFTTGSCTNPIFAAAGDQKTVKLAVTCLGQKFAAAEWSPGNPDFVTWEESDLIVTLRRVETQPAGQPAEDGGGSGDNSQ